jgi:Bacterial Ig-like domain (group 3)
MRLNRPQGAATNSARTAGVARRRLGAGAIRLLSVTAVAAATCGLWAGAASAATAAPAAGTATTTTITNTPNPGTVDAGDPFTINVTVTSGGGTPTGTVTIAPSDATLPASYSCTATLSGGAGSCEVTPGAGTFGDVDYTATYAGNATFAGSASGTFTLIVPETTTTSVSPATAAPGAVTLTAAVVGQDKGNISPSAGGTGSVTFYNDGTVISTACAAVSLTYDGGGANLATCKTTLPAGKYTIAADYSGDPNNLASSATETLTVATPPPAKHATKTSGSASPKSTKVHRVVKLSATVTGGSTPGGKVTFIWRGHVVCSARLSHGKAHCSIEFLKAGKYWIRAYYSGNSTHKTSHSRLFEVKVKK